MKPNFDQNWTTTNGGVPLNDSEVERYIGVVPRPNQVHLAQQPFYCFMHFGMNTANQREWGSGRETVQDFTIKKIKPEQWVRTVKAAGASDTFVSQNWLISTYLVLTFAELLLSPMGISFVSKVAPPKYKGMMMGCWFAATAVGNYATSLIGYLWGSGMALWMVWSVLIVLCLLSALFIFSIMKKLENATA